MGIHWAQRLLGEFLYPAPQRHVDNLLSSYTLYILPSGHRAKCKVNPCLQRYSEMDSQKVVAIEERAPRLKGSAPSVGWLFLGNPNNFCFVKNLSIVYTGR